AYKLRGSGSPFAPTQGMEIESPLSAIGDWLIPSAWAAGWHGGTYAQVQGGGLRLSNLKRTLPGNWHILLTANGPFFGGAAVWGAILALHSRRLLFAAAVPYTVTAFLFYSCWAR